MIGRRRIIFLMKFFHLILLCSIPLILSSCGPSNNRAPVSTYGASSGFGATGVHIVEPGDTLWSISNRYKIGMRDIVLTNKIAAPFVLHPSQRIQLPPPMEYRVREGDSLYRVSQINDVPISTIARLNNLRAPYTIQPGQTLRLPSEHHKGAHHKQLAQASVKPSTKPSRSSAMAPKTISKARTPVSARAPASSGKFSQPVSGRVVSRFGPKKGGLHNDGVNIAAPRGTPIGAAENGVVVYAGSELRGSGNLVLLRHDNGYLTAYAHLDKITAQRGSIIQKGQKLGTVGSSGSVASPQLHFEVRKGTRALDPSKYISL